MTGEVDRDERSPRASATVSQVGVLRAAVEQDDLGAAASPQTEAR